MTVPGPSAESPPVLDRPVFIVAPPCSEAGLLLEMLSGFADAVTTGDEDDQLIEGIAALHPGERGWDSNRLGPIDAGPAVVSALRSRALGELRDRGGAHVPEATGSVRLIDASSKNCLRVPFLDKVFPDARFVFFQRDPRACLAGMMTAWQSGDCATYPDLPGWTGPHAWSLVLTPGWRSLTTEPLASVVAHQWRAAAEILLSDLAAVDQGRCTAVGYQELLADPQGEVERLCEFLGLTWDPSTEIPPPLPGHHLTPPPADAPQREEELADVLPHTAFAADRGRRLVEVVVDGAPVTGSEGTVAAVPASPLSSTSQSNFAPILRELRSSLMVSTYQSGQLVAVRELDGKLNTHFRAMDAPMGVTAAGGRLLVGTRAEVREYHDVPAVLGRLQPPGQHDACFLPRRVHYTGDIRVHDVGWVKDEPWVVATRFSCLATLDGVHSFVPRWQPSFVTDIQAEDRCHLNGMAVLDDEVRWVTALGVSDTAGGWRERKADGGVIIDVASDEIAVRGLSMPHSPRWYRGRLWVLESGEGTLAAVDLESGTVETVVELPGFTRGLAFAGPLAFIGLSKVREATTFGGLPLTGRLEERECGVWVVNIETGTTVSYLRFSDQVQEIFDVCLLPGVRFPELLESGDPIADSAFVLPALPQG